MCRVRDTRLRREQRPQSALCRRFQENQSCRSEPSAHPESGESKTTLPRPLPEVIQQLDNVNILPSNSHKPPFVRARNTPRSILSLVIIRCLEKTRLTHLLGNLRPPPSRSYLNRFLPREK